MHVQNNDVVGPKVAFGLALRTLQNIEAEGPYAQHDEEFKVEHRGLQQSPSFLIWCAIDARLILLQVLSSSPIESKIYVKHQEMFLYRRFKQSWHVSFGHLHACKYLQQLI